MSHYDVLILGSGLAGMSAALHLADRCKVALVTKHELLDGASSWAQGGIAAVLDGSDSIEDHIRDTLVAGAGLCHPDAVRFVVERGRRSVEWLVGQGVPFTREDGNQDELHLTREGGHSHRRIVHAADATGSAVQKTLVQSVKSHPNIDVLEWHIGVDLVTTRKHLGLPGATRVLGAYVLDIKQGHVKTLSARHTVLATGGAGKVYLYTTNPDTATGDGVAMGWRAGASVSNMEFIQFHPTCLFHPHAKSFLISEAVRGEGGLLRLPDGERFMPRHDERAELAPRDIVARAVFAEIAAGRGAFLDARKALGAKFAEKFPGVYGVCQSAGIDPAKDLIPVAPAEHYHMGGIAVDERGRSTLEGLWAAGECASTGVHGANRLASNSLLEAVVYGGRVA
ncbi:MAG: L-aspartate oxidase, partial [Usitatibacter sp.]